ncbi:Ricin B lectin domain-containing protein OS=Streptomyces griseorubiginosus OX=67304 GN=AQJ54_40375 PE=4 SV=1 [Streptomyces griseorubiginosus]
MSSSEQREPVGGAEPTGAPVGAPRPETRPESGGAAAPPGGGVGVGTAVRSLLQRPRTEVSRRPDLGSPAIWERDIHVLPAQVTGPSGPRGGSTRPGRPTRTVVWAAVCGVALLSVPFVVVAAGSHSDKPHGTEHTTLADDYRPAPAVPGTVAAPLPPSQMASSSPSLSHKPSHAPSPSVTPATSHTAPHTKEAPPPVRTPATHKPTFAEVFGGANRVLLKNLATGMCADLPQYGKGSVGGVIDQYDCQAGVSDNQEWDLKVVGTPKGPHGARLFTISNDTDHLCMDIPWYGVEPVGPPG